MVSISMGESGRVYFGGHGPTIWYLLQTQPKSRSGNKLIDSQLQPLRDPSPVVFICASCAWGVTTVYLLAWYRHHTYQNYFLTFGVSVPLLLEAVNLIREEQPAYLVIKYTPLWISFVMALSMILQWLLFRDDDR